MEKRSQICSFRLTPSFAQQTRERARQDGYRSRSALVRELLSAFVVG